LLAELDQNAMSQLEEVCWTLVWKSRIYWGQFQSPSLHLSFLQIQNYSFPPKI